MRRFSQRNSLVTLSDINITPLLDLAFVLLIIFVITTPLLEQSLEVKLPKGGRPDRPVNERDFRTVEISPKGYYVFDGKPMALAQIEQVLVNEGRANPNLVLRIRADRTTPFDHVFQIQDMCANHNIKISLRSEPRENKR
jgi:biopolymer transport protein ExbD